MDKVEFINKIKAIGECKNDTERNELLIQLQEEGEKDYSRMTDLEAQNNQLSSDVEDLRSANMKLFKRIGVNTKTEEDQDPSEDKNKKPLKYEDLFNEKGEIK